MTRKKLLSSAHDCSEGGLAVALAECCISNKEKKVGAIIDNLPFDLNPAAMLFGESQSRIIISTDKKNIAAIEKIAGNHKISCNKIGTTGGDRFIIDKDKHKLIDLSLEQIAQAWSDALRRKIDCSC
jgi:phosphoribosylformylglycinamidine synthase